MKFLFTAWMRRERLARYAADDQYSTFVRKGQKMKKKKLLLAGLLAGLSLAGATASANTIFLKEVGLGTTFGASDGSGEFIYTYSVNLTAPSSVTDDNPPGASHFTLFDVNGLDFATASFSPTLGLPGTFALSIAQTGPSYGFVDFGTFDDTALYNLTATYSGADVSGMAFPVLGTLTFKSTVGTSLIPLQQNSFDVSTSANSGPIPVFGPDENGGGPPLTPLPAAAWAGMGMFGLFGAGKFRKRKA